VDPASTLHTDKAQVYRYLPVAGHEAVDHGKEYVRQYAARPAHG
jgi:hypothetical protein